MEISYTITVYNELEQLKQLLSLLALCKTNHDEIVVVHTYRNEEEKEIENFKAIKKICKHVSIYKNYHFQNKFAELKNYLNSFATKEFIINFDADEFASADTVKLWKQVISENNHDLYLVPRVNKVRDYTLDDMKKYNWQINENGWINWPDYQPRIFKNNGKIKWEGNVHEQLTGQENTGALPADPRFAIIHNKDIDRQRKQNELYENIIRE
jgi:glycosyltransferase involved in cell wall biosynthesis